MRRPWRRRQAEAGAGAELARAEADLSRARQQRVRTEVIRPLQELAERNQFAALIHASLTEGRGRDR